MSHTPDPVTPEPVADDLEASRIRAAYARRGDLERRIGHNRGQAAIIAERDAMIRETLRALDAPARELLDVGCGDGTVLGSLVRDGVVAHGVGGDLLPERIARARIAWPALRFDVLDAAHLPFPDATFDVVLAMTVLSSVQDENRRHAIIGQIARVLKPGGAFVWYDMRRRSPGNRDVRPFTAKDVRRALTGWKIQARSLTVAPPLARRLGLGTSFVYPLLALCGPLCTHQLGVAIKPSAVARP